MAMSYNGQYMLIVIYILSIGLKTTKGKVVHNNWEVVEKLAEQHPYIVAILDHAKKYSCTGSIIKKRTVLTSGNCVSLEPKYVAVGVAIVSNNSSKNIIDVAYTMLHEDYTFELKSANPNVTKTHSNIGLVFVVEPILQLFIPEAEIGNYYASELRDRILNVVGYGFLKGSKVIGLQEQIYYQSPCVNPKWYYCICGTEYRTYSKPYNTVEFGKGAPVLLGNEVIGITASPCGILFTKPNNLHYNIFTVIGPYTSWINKSESNPMFSLRTLNNSNCDRSDNSMFLCLQILLLCIKLFT